MKMLEDAKKMFLGLAALDGDDLISTINSLRQELSKYSPFRNEPVDCVRWVKSDLVMANEYNPNSVAPTEMKLLEHSIQEDGYTQPIVSWANAENYEVIDGFHRHRVGKESAPIQARVHGYLPLVVVNDSRLGLGDRMASTIRHNRARGKHKVEAMSDIVVELKRRFWSDEKIGKELGMEADEVLRLTQITGLTDMFADAEFSEAWEAESFSDIDTAPTVEEITE
jgi:ParB-like chromosome segregation protein Spo0J